MGVKVRATAFFDFTHRIFQLPWPFVRACTHQGIKNIDHRHQSRNQGNVGPLGCVGVAGSIPMLVVRSGYQPGQRHRRAAFEDGIANQRVLLDDGKLFGGEATRFSQYLIRYPDLSDVV